MKIKLSGTMREIPLHSESDVPKPFEPDLSELMETASDDEGSYDLILKLSWDRDDFRDVTPDDIMECIRNHMSTLPPVEGNHCNCEYDCCAHRQISSCTVYMKDGGALVLWHTYLNI